MWNHKDFSTYLKNLISMGCDIRNSHIGGFSQQDNSNSPKFCIFRDIHKGKNTEVKKYCT